MKATGIARKDWQPQEGPLMQRKSIGRSVSVGDPVGNLHGSAGLAWYLPRYSPVGRCRGGFSKTASVLRWSVFATM